MKVKLALLEASPSSSHNPKSFQPNNKGLVAETFDWGEEEVSDKEEVTQVKVLMALADDELTVGKSHARNGEWVDITKRKKVLGGELLTESSSKMNENENIFVPASMGYDQEMVPKTKDWVERLNPDSKFPNFNTGRILVTESQDVNESLEPTKTLNTPESSQDSEAESLTPLPPVKNLQGALPSSEMLIDENVNSNQKTQELTSNIQKTESSKSVDSSRMSQDSKPKVQNTGSSKSLRPKPIQKPQLKCELCHYTNHSIDDCYRILYCMCEICESYDHSTLGHNRVIQIRGEVLAESSQSNESSIGRHIKEPIWYLDSGCSRSMTGVKSYLYKYVKQPNTKVVFGDNSSCITEGYGLINYGGIVFTKVAFVNGLKYNLISISQLCDSKYIVQFDDKQRTIFNANKEIVLIAPRRNDVYVLDMSSLTPNGACFFAKASESVNWP
ncbi:hypothetical protein Tco_0363000 [Tanacetum coccineum]